MAKLSAEAREAESLLQGLRNALDGQPHLLRGAPATGALFPTAKTADPPAQKALDSGYIERTDPPAGVKAKKGQVFIRLTARGQQFIVAHDPGQKLLEALLPIVQQLAGRLNGLADALEQTTSLIQAALRPSSGAGSTAAHPLPDTVAPPPTTDLPGVLHHAYDRLRGLTEFRDGLVALPRLYH